MKNGWQPTTLGAICAFENGDRGVNYPGRSVQTATGVPFINAGHLTDDGLDLDNMNYIPRERFDLLGNGKISKSDILFCLRGSLGKFASVGSLSEGAIASSIVIIRPKELVENRFLLMYLRSDLCAAMIERYKNGAAQPNLSALSLSKFEIPLPPLPEQRRIVGILDEAFEVLATAKANAEKNLQNARALFESHLQSVFTNRGKGWVESTVGESCVLRSGTTLPKELEQSEGEVPYLKVADMNLAGNLDGVTCSSRYVNRSDLNASNFLPVGTTIFPKRGGAILTNKKRLTKRVICADLNIMGVIPGKTLVPELLYLYFLNVDMRELGSGSSIPQINNYDIEPLSISFPPLLSEQSRIVNELEALSEETQRLARIYERKLSALEALKKSLLHQAFNGEL
jgi:type I restriction enzyme S subunit